MTSAIDPAEWERWRLILGDSAHQALGRSDSDYVRRQDAALDWLYGRDADTDGRGVRGQSGADGNDRSAGSEASRLTTFDWIDEITQLFPRETIERLEQDAVDRYEIHDVVTNPDVLARVTPNQALLRAVLRTKHLMNPKVLELARKIVADVVKDLVERMATEVRSAFSGSRSRRPSQFRQARNFDIRRTLRGNLSHYDPGTRRIAVEKAYFFTRSRRHLERWQVILVVDQSGSMVSSVIHSAVTAACLWGLPGVSTHLIAFDTNVIDLTADIVDPVETLMKVNLGGGTDIAKAMRYAETVIGDPRRCIVALITDFFEGGSPHDLVRTIKAMVEQGTSVLGLAALDDQANPAYDQGLAQRVANAGAFVGAMTPGHLAEFVAERVGR